MKLHEVLEPQELDESVLRKAALAGAIGASLLGAPKHTSPPTAGAKPVPQVSTTHTPQTLTPKEVDRRIDALYKDSRPIEHLSQQIASEYKINPELAETIVRLAFRHEKEDFPTASDILGVIAVESSFDPTAVSKLRRDPARGLMQVRAGIWDVDPNKLQNNLDKQVKVGADILHHYYEILGSKEAALHAYNMGITNFRKGQKNNRYVNKVQHHAQHYANL